MKKTVFAVTSAAIWVVISEFERNEWLIKNIWTEHYRSLGLTFATTPANGAFWTVWSFLLAWVVFKLLQKFSYRETVALAWTAAFPMMWITLWNLQVLPLPSLVFALPLSILEVAVAASIIQKLKA